MADIADIQKLEQALGHRFSHPEFLEQALTHSSYSNELAHDASAEERPTHNEQLEFLGDAVLNLITSRTLFERYPGYSEGLLSKTRAHLVSARHLIKIARHVRLGDHLRLGKGEERTGGRQKPALLVDTLEAVIAALFLDGGLDVAMRFVQKEVLHPELERMGDPEATIAMTDQKSALQEWLQATGRPQPSYHVIREEGPDHKKIFTVEVRVTDESGNERVTARARGITKKQAEQSAAQEALNTLQTEEVTLTATRNE